MEQLSYTYSNLLECITYGDLMENKSLIDYSALRDPLIISPKRNHV